MRRYVLVAAVLLAACQQDPPGRCAASLDCALGQECSDGVCIALATDHQVGSRCIRDADCVGWAGCAAETCRLAAGRCTTSADCAGWEACDATHACATAPGRCASTPDCRSWEVCNATYYCENAPGYCAVNADCAAWQQCNAVHACATAPGFCAAEADCAAWQDCGADHLCALTPGRCGTSADCASWDLCDATHACVHGPGYCAASTDCAAWQQCSALHACVAAPGFCATGADCQAWESCNTGHTCELAPGRCLSTADCATWQQCDAANACVTAPGFCASAVDCQAWEQCDAAHSCALAPGRCLVKADCGAGQVCDGHDCVTDPCTSLPPICSGTTSGFFLTGEAGSLSPGTHQATHFDSTFSGHPSTGFSDPGSTWQAVSVGVRDASGAFWDFAFGAPRLAPGLYKVGPGLNGLFAGPDGADCWESGGWYSLCEVEVGHEPWYGWFDPPTLSVTAAYHWTCGARGTGPAIDGCFRFFLGSQPGQFGPPRQLEGAGRSVCATGNGALRCWGWARAAPYAIAPDAVSGFGVGAYHACAVFAGGEVRCWGRNWEGQSGNGANTDEVPRPLTVIASGAVDAFAGYGASYALMSDGRILYWGTDPTAPRTDVPAERFPADTFVYISGEYGFACGLTPTGTVRCWGSNDQGQLGIGRQFTSGGSLTSDVPLDVVGLPGPVVRLDTGDNTACAVIDSGALYCWGHNGVGEIGIGTTDSPVLTPTLVPGLDVGVTDVAVGGSHVCAIQAGGVLCWGRALGGRLGNGVTDYTIFPSPVQVSGLGPGSGAVQVAANWDGSCARFQDETLWCWGSEVAGDGVQNDEPVPVQVTRW